MKTSHTEFDGDRAVVIGGSGSQTDRLDVLQEAFFTVRGEERLIILTEVFGQ